MGKIRKIVVVLVFIICFTSLSGKQEKILIMYADGILFRQTAKSIKLELQENFEVDSLIVRRGSDSTEICEYILNSNPKALILMDNIAINHFRKCQERENIQIPSISLMSIDVKNAIRDLRNAVGISYEVPIITSVLNVQTIIDKQLSKIGVIHREFMNDFISNNKKYCDKENIELVNINLPDKNINFKKRVKHELKKMLTDDTIEAIWIPNDNELLRRDIIRDIWIPLLSRYHKPTIVGIRQFVNPSLKFGTFAVIPDHISLGTQAVNMVYELKENNWRVKKKYVDPPVSIYKIINYEKLRHDYSNRKFNLSAVDTVLQADK